ncbi:MAG: PD-(D/E)XK nuclease family transposase, partial [Oscillospiraceae bacterium]|nr:PD-(D/E)XK nuclease family transposase [Oscillospiraceae bacterium]
TAEYVTRLCTGILDLKLINSNIQQALRNLIGKSSTLDFIGEDSTGKVFNIEVQNVGDKAHFGPMRSRFHQSIIDASLVPQGEKDFDKLPEVYVIFITPFNPLKKYGLNKIAYEKISYLNGVEWNNKVHEIYLNAEVKDDSKLSDMLQYFKTADPNDNRFGPLSNSVRKYKYADEEVDYMCRAVEEYAKERERIAVEKATKEAAEEMARTKSGIVDSLLKKGFSIKDALEIADIDEETYNSHRIA